VLLCSRPARASEVTVPEVDMGLAKGALNMQDVKMTDQVGRHENAGHEILT